MADVSTAEVVHQRGEVTEGVDGAVIELNSIGGKSPPILKQPVGVLGIGAAAHHHR